MSRARRFYAPELALALAQTRDTVSLAEEEAHHVLHVLRLAEGSEVELFDGEGRAARGVIARAEAESVQVRVEEELATAESSLDLTVALAVPKPERMAFAVQKLTELGVRRIVPLATERSTRRDRAPLEHRLTRWRRIVLEATKQSGRSRLADVTPERDVSEVLVEAERSGACVILAEPGGGAGRGGGLERKEASPWVALVGPEGGWSEGELEIARRHGARFIGLGPRILRTETAAVVVASLLQARHGDIAP